MGGGSRGQTTQTAPATQAQGTSSVETYSPQPQAQPMPSYSPPPQVQAQQPINNPFNPQQPMNTFNPQEQVQQPINNPFSMPTQPMTAFAPPPQQASPALEQQVFTNPFNPQLQASQAPEQMALFNPPPPQQATNTQAPAPMAPNPYNSYRDMSKTYLPYADPYSTVVNRPQPIQAQAQGQPMFPGFGFPAASNNPLQPADPNRPVFPGVVNRKI